MQNQLLPDIIIPESDYRCLERLALTAAERDEPDAKFLVSEINRAKIVPDQAVQLDSIVTMGSWVTYWINWGFPRQTRQLVYPEESTLVDA
jgi:regulator of nucleoside diphosphate kinase